MSVLYPNESPAYRAAREQLLLQEIELRRATEAVAASNGTIRHFWGAELLYASPEPDQKYRHVGTLEPLWNFFDLIPEGRGAGWDEQLSYPCCGSR
jgi:predicted dithiol-disulfide oxidoreductase (DUF899 family)